MVVDGVLAGNSMLGARVGATRGIPLSDAVGAAWPSLLAKRRKEPGFAIHFPGYLCA